MEQKIIKTTSDLLVKQIQLRLRGKKEIAVAFSGSMDSTLMAFLVNQYTNTKPILYTIGFPDSYDIKTSKQTLDQLAQPNQIEHKTIILKESKIQIYLSEYLQLTKDDNKVSISFTLPFFILLSHLKEKYVMTGHGADTLFGGFHKYLESKSLKTDISKNYIEFLSKLPERESLIAKHYGKDLILPFADTELSNYVLSVPEETFIKKGERKWLLKQVALHVGLPEAIVNLPKKAFQYSTGIDKYLKKLRSEN